MYHPEWMDLYPSFFFYFKRGCIQGDPISPYIFILYAEILGKMIRNNDIRGIIIDIKEYKKVSMQTILNFS